VETGEVKQFIIHYKSRNTDIGTAYLRDIDPEKGCAEAGAYIGESEYIGKGLGLELGRKLIDVGFNDLNLRYIYIRVLKDNAGTIRFNEMLGYKRIDNPEDFGIPGSGDDRVVFMMIQSRATTLDKA
jgi:RimJ/RimL family protein N-acetyltransferase